MMFLTLTAEPQFRKDRILAASLHRAKHLIDTTEPMLIASKDDS
jgi:hypothetical protein